MKKLLFIFIASILGFISFGQQIADTDFMEFSQRQDSLMVLAYKNKDVNEYNKLFTAYLAKYNKLNAKNKKDFKSALSGAYYNFACTYAITGNKVKALDCLEKSDYLDYDHLMEDSDMDPLRREPRFIKFLNKAKNTKSEYQVLLQKDDKYNMAEKSTFPAFTYQSANDEHLVALKKAFNLDSVAGGGNDESRMINLLHWVHNLIPHNGSKGNPAVKNAMSLVTECRRDGKTLNCRGLAILLNEVYLAEGFKSRFVTCLPKDTTDGDCHVIDMVYSKRLGRWLWMDPTFDAYVMDEKGELLGLREVRERLIHSKTLIINPDANHNHENSQSLSYYLGYYMSKNLYRIECPLTSEYNYETYEPGKARAYVQLRPSGNMRATRDYKNTQGVSEFTEYSTANPTLFWKEP